MWVGGDRSRERILSRLRAQRGARLRLDLMTPEIMTRATIKRWALNRLSHPDTHTFLLLLLFFFMFYASIQVLFCKECYFYRLLVKVSFILKK